MNPTRFRFCGFCGSPMSPAGVAWPATEAKAARAAPNGGEHPAGAPTDPERRHLTVMFCDLVGSTRLSQRLDPEEWRDVVRSYQSTSAEVIERFGGYIAQYLGDGLLVYFGYPVSLEDEADRAVGAGLGIIEAIEALNETLQASLEIELAVRVGIHTGVVVIGEVGGGARREQLALGDTPNIAARLQGIAEPDTVVVSSETYRLVARTFECEELPGRSFKGVPIAEPVYRVLRERRFVGPEPGPRDGRQTSLLGREHELHLLLDRYEGVRRGEGRAVCISGDPGIGKSHLIREFKLRTSIDQGSGFDTRCLPYYRNTAFRSFIDLLEQQLAGAPESGNGRLEALATLVEKCGLEKDTIPLFAALLSVPTRGELPAEPPPLVKAKTKSALVQMLLRAARDQPLVVTIEDLHFADPTTLEVLDELMKQIATSKLFLMFTFRPEFGVRWGSHPHVTHIYLGRLNRRQVEMLVTEVTGGKPLPSELLSQIVERTDGVPLFIEELTKMLLESGKLVEGESGYELKGDVPSLGIPTTLRDSLEARLDRPAVKEVAQLAATIGREFRYELLRAVSQADEATLRSALEQLMDVCLIYARGTPPRATYAFKHAMIQEAAYESLLKSTRQRHHQRIANALLEGLPDTDEAQPELLAFHYTAAGLIEPAIGAWLRAGKQALERSAYAEAVAHLTDGLQLLMTVPETKRKAQQELELLCTLAPALAATRGYTSSEVFDVYVRARELAGRTGRTELLVQVLSGLFAYHFVRAELGPTAEMAQELAKLSKKVGTEEAALAAHTTMGVVSLASGELAAANEHLDRVIHTYDAARHAALAITFGQDFGVVANAYSALLLWITGAPDQARVRADNALMLASWLRHPHSVALALAIGALVHHLARDAAKVRELARKLYDLASAQGFEHWVVESKFLMAWVTAEEGRAEEALIAMEEQIATFRANESLLPYQFHQRLVAELMSRLGRSDEALVMLEELELMIEQADQGWWWESEVWRLRADIALTLNENDPRAEDDYLRALDIARGRRARSFELRAAIGLARLWRQRGRTADARTLLADCYEGFTEGFDTGDLLETHALIDELEAILV
jgi:predicted ATPase/class 3 adenylate cyclase